MELTERERDQLDVEVLTTSALRDGLTHATGKPESCTYKQANALGAQVAPVLYLSVNRILDMPRESSDAQMYRQLARAESSLVGNDITPSEYVENEIVKLEEQIQAAEEFGQDDHLMKKKLDKLQAVLQELKPKKRREVNFILGDAIKSGLGLPKVYESEDYKDYKLNAERILRVRVAHLTNLEDKLGCDLIYENLDFKRQTARLVMVQYKTWEKSSLHYNTREGGQYQRIKDFTCSGRLCDPDRITYRCYRMPNCAGFVRPTDRLLDPTSPITSSSLHIPICVLNDAWTTNQNGGRSVRRENVANRSLTHKTFGELFDNCMVGSKEISWDKMTELYRAYEVFETDERVVVHMQDVDNLA